MLCMVATNVSAQPAQTATYAARCTGGCHTNPESPYPWQMDAASNSGYINTAAGKGMTVFSPALSAAELLDLQTYIQDYLDYKMATAPPAVVHIPFNTATVVSLANSYLYFGHSYGSYTGLTGVASTAKASISSYGTSPMQATYTPISCSLGADTITFHATGSGNSSDRTQGVFIDDPTFNPVVSPGAGALPAGQTGVAYSQSITT